MKKSQSKGEDEKTIRSTSPAITQNNTAEVIE